jgi:hypothetical protein
MPKRARCDRRTGPKAGLAFAALALLFSVVVQARSQADTRSVNDVLARAIESINRRATQHHTIRRLRAGTLNGHHEGWLDAEASVDHGQSFRYRVLSEGGSKRTRDKVLRGVLDGERDAIENWSASALVPDNYVFVVEQDQQEGSVRVRMTPKREDARLIDGVLTLTSEGQLVSVEGRLAKSPSFWVRSVTVIRRFATLNGVTLPVAVESVANVRMVGASRFSMTYEYTTVNGTAVAPGFPSDGTAPSAHLLALHAGFTRQVGEPRLSAERSK